MAWVSIWRCFDSFFSPILCERTAKLKKRSIGRRLKERSSNLTDDDVAVVDVDLRLKLKELVCTGNKEKTALTLSSPTSTHKYTATENNDITAFQIGFVIVKLFNVTWEKGEQKFVVKAKIKKSRTSLVNPKKRSKKKGEKIYTKKKEKLSGLFNIPPSFSPSVKTFQPDQI